MMNITVPNGFKAPEKYALRAVKPTAVTPTLDGVITPEEWGDTPDFHLDRTVTGGKRTYCLDQFTGEGRLIPEIDCFWRYDDEYVYAALRVREPAIVSASGLSTVTGVDRSVAVTLGGARFQMAFAEGEITDAFGNMAGAYRMEDGVHAFEFAAPRAAVLDGKNAFLGNISYELTVLYTRNDTGSSGFNNLRTRTTPMYGESDFTDDVFVLTEGTPAPAPVLKVGVERSYSIEDVSIGGGYTLRFSEPAVLAQGDLGDQIWGHYNFPEVRRFTDGSIVATWSYHRDSIYESGDKAPRPTHSVSRDNGLSWTNGEKFAGAVDKGPMKNGKYFAGFAGASSTKKDYLNQYTPAVTWGGGYRMFFAEDVKEPEDKTVFASEYDPVTGQTTSFEVKVNWPYMPLTEHPGGYVYPLQQAFALCNRSVQNVNGDLYFPLYSYGFDSFASSREEAVNPYSRFYSVFFFRSTDCGRTWDLLAQMMPSEKIKNFAEGFDEPEMTVMPDGSFVMLMRTGSGNPSYKVRSTDGGVTWSEPEKFDDIGVLPQIITLGCGVTLASYGRPTMRFAASVDPDGAQWTQFDVPLTGGAGTSCYYTDLLALDDNTALYIYADSLYPNENGAPVKTILIRTVTVVSE